MGPCLGDRPNLQLQPNWPSLAPNTNFPINSYSLNSPYCNTLYTNTLYRVLSLKLGLHCTNLCEQIHLEALVITKLFDLNSEPFYYRADSQEKIFRTQSASISIRSIKAYCNIQRCSKQYSRFL